jgi:hypothetical protein
MTFIQNWLMFNCLLAEGRTMIRFKYTVQINILYWKFLSHYLHGSYMFKKNERNYAHNVTLTRLNIIRVYLVYTYLLA